jgi:hypothetical protein
VVRLDVPFSALDTTPLPVLAGRIEQGIAAELLLCSVKSTRRTPRRDRW